MMIHKEQCVDCDSTFTPSIMSGRRKKQITRRDGSHSHYVPDGHVCEKCMSPKEADKLDDPRCENCGGRAMPKNKFCPPCFKDIEGELLRMLSEPTVDMVARRQAVGQLAIERLGRAIAPQVNKFMAELMKNIDNLKEADQ